MKENNASHNSDKTKAQSSSHQKHSDHEPHGDKHPHGDEAHSDAHSSHGHKTSREEAPKKQAHKGSELETLKATLEQTQKDLLYLRAEFENYKKHNIKERSQLVKYGGERLVRSLLDVLDNFDRALAVDVTPGNLESFFQGVQMTANELYESLEQNGVKKVTPHAEPFDPQMHEALSSEPTSEFPEGHICKVFRSAYTLHDKVIRPAQVVVATKPKNNESFEE